MNDIPTISETRQARETFIKGFEAHYPGVDPRMSLLGMKENGYEYLTEKYGNQLIKIPSCFWKHAIEGFTTLGIIYAIHLIIEMVRHFFF